MKPSINLRDAFFEQLKNNAEIFQIIREHSFESLTFRRPSIDPQQEWTEERFWQLLGYDGSSIADHRAFREACLWESDRPIFQRLLDQPGKAAIRYRHRDGSCVRIDTQSISLPDEYLIQLHRSISTDCASELKQPQVDTEALATRIIDLVGVSIIVLDTDRRVVLWNKRAEQIFGYRSEEVMGQRLDDKLLLDELRYEAHQIMEDLSSGKRWQGEFRLLRKDGKEVELLIVNRPIHNASDEVIAFIGASVDITAQNNARKALRQIQKRMELAIDTGQLGIWELDLGTGRLDWNDQMFSIYGLSQEEFEENVEVWRSLVHPDDLKNADAEMARILEGETVHNVRYRIRTKENIIKHIYASGTPIYDPSGKLTKLVGVNIDVSRMVDLEKAEILAKELAIRNRDIEQFVSIASHDLQEPLRTITSFAQLLIRRFSDELPEDGQQILEFIINASRRLSMLVRGLIDYNRLGVDRKKTLVNIQEVVAEITEDLEASIRKTNAEITVESLPEINAYPIEIRQLFQNLISNAIKFHRPDAPPEIRIAAWPEDNGYTFVVKDNGIGIPPEQRERIFEIFRRLDTEGTYEGSGIGLAYCKKIVTLHDGQIWVESIPSAGSAFYVHLPQQDPFLENSMSSKEALSRSNNPVVDR